MGTKEPSTLRQVQERVTKWANKLPAKELAAQLGVEVRTAKNWQDGHMPSSPHFLAMVMLWGKDFLEDAYGPVLENDNPDIETQFIRLEAQLAIMRKQHKQGKL